MKRRLFLLSPFLLSLGQNARAQTPPWSWKLLRGGFDGKVIWAGVEIALADNWKTYWRVPGDAGISPSLSFAGENLKSFEVFLPLPHRFEDAAGTTLGYKHSVIFPVAITPVDATASLSVLLNGFIGVCDVVCIPAQFSTELAFDPATPNGPDQITLSAAMSLVPRKQQTGPVKAARAALHNGKPALECELAQPVDDLFAEGLPQHYFGKPIFESLKAILPATGVKTPEELHGTNVRLTIAANGNGLEQVLVVA
jgi:DsbC/DsbD-like thiol-disulfide interchange protein